MAVNNRVRHYIHQMFETYIWSGYCNVGARITSEKGKDDDGVRLIRL